MFELGDGSLVDLEFDREFLRGALKRFYHYASDLISGECARSPSTGAGGADARAVGGW